MTPPNTVDGDLIHPADPIRRPIRPHVRPAKRYPTKPLAPQGGERVAEGRVRGRAIGPLPPDTRGSSSPATSSEVSSAEEQFMSRVQSFARTMRRYPTRAEGRLWRWLRNRRFEGHKFRRQHPVGRYILDFYCPELKLAIEVDGHHHDRPMMRDYDGARANELSRRGIEVIRLSNDLVLRDVRTAGNCILVAVERRTRAE
jgi:very-short-patch-repair endonuclease